MKFRRQHQVNTEFRPPVTELEPLANRKYTMTHSDDTGELFVTIANKYAEDQFGPFRDEVILEWTSVGSRPILYGEVLIDGEGVSGNPQTREAIFKREMPLALQAIRYADRKFFNADSDRDQIPIIIQFKSSSPIYNHLYALGTMGDYTSFSRRNKKMYSFS